MVPAVSSVFCTSSKEDKCIGHPRSILQHKRNLMIPQEVRELRVQPRSFANFNSILVVSWQFLQEWNEPIGERVPIWKYASAEKRILKDDRPKLFTQNIHDFQELRDFGITVHETLSCVMVCGTFTEKTKPSGVRAFQFSTVRAGGHA